MNSGQDLPQESASCTNDTAMRKRSGRRGQDLRCGSGVFLFALNGSIKFTLASSSRFLSYKQRNYIQLGVETQHTKTKASTENYKTQNPMNDIELIAKSETEQNQGDTRQVDEEIYRDNGNNTKPPASEETEKSKGDFKDEAVISSEAPKPSIEDERIRKKYLNRENWIKSVGVIYRHIAGVLFILVILSFISSIYLSSLIEGYRIEFSNIVISGLMLITAVFLRNASLSIKSLTGIHAITACLSSLVMFIISIPLLMLFAPFIGIYGMLKLLLLVYGGLLCAFIPFVILGKKARFIFSSKYRNVIENTPHLDSARSSIYLKAYGMMFFIPLAIVFSGYLYGLFS